MLAEKLDAVERIHLVGIGTSWHASLMGEYLLRKVAGRDDARAWNAFEFWANPPKLAPGDGVLVMSHRGTMRYSAHALEAARAAGGPTGLITGLDSRAPAGAADMVLQTCPQEKSSAFTISHTTAMTVLAMLAKELAILRDQPGAREFGTALKDLPSLVDSALHLEAAVQDWARHAKGYDRFYFLGWGPNVSTAYEVPLKLKETCYAIAEGFELEQYLHGLFLATEPECLVTLIAPPIHGLRRAVDILEAVKAVNAGTAALVEAGDTDITSLVDTVFTLPTTHEALTPIVYLVPLQLFTYWLTLELNRNPDVFRQDDPSHRAARQMFEL